MGCFLRMLIIGSILLLGATSAFSLLVLGSARVLGEVAFVAEDDAIVLIVLNVLSLLALVAIVLALWNGSRQRSRFKSRIELLEKQITARKSGPAYTAGVQIPPVIQSPTHIQTRRSGFCPHCGATLEEAGSYCPACGGRIPLT